MRPWTPDENTFLADNYPAMSCRQIAERLNRTRSAVKTQITRVFDRSVRRNRVWKEDDIKVVAKSYKEQTDIQIANRIGRSPASVKRLRQRNGYDRELVRNWTEQEDAILMAACSRASRMQYNAGVLSEVAIAVKRSLSAVRSRAAHLGIGPKANYARKVERNGYRIVRNADGKRVHEHVCLMQAEIGRVLMPGECVHHVNGNKRDNQIDNLYLCESRSEHRRVHNQFFELAAELIARGIVRFDHEAGVYLIVEGSQG